MSNKNSFDNKDVTPCVSVIVTTFNRRELLAETLDSIIAQTFGDFELIIIDNMSADGTEERVESIGDSRINYFSNPNNGIIAINRNFGIRRARGKYIAFCDDDDLWLPEKLEWQVNLLEKNEDVALCYTHAESFIDNRIINLKMNKRNVYKNHFFHLLSGGLFPNSSVLIRRDVFYKVGFLTENPLLREDYEMWLKVTKLFEIVGINSSLVRYRFHQANVSSNRASETLRAIRTIRSLVGPLDIPLSYLVYGISLQYLKFVYYAIGRLVKLDFKIN